MDHQQKEFYTEPVLTVHELLRDVTGSKYTEKTCDSKLGEVCPD